ncbi:MAG: glycerate kinase [Mycetocola sp.]
MRTVLIAPDSFKGTYSSAEVADAIREGIVSVPGLSARVAPVADGGEGTVDALREDLSLETVETATVNPWGEPMRASYGRGGAGNSLAIVEVAAANGITTPTRGIRDPITASTYGTGLLIMDAISRGAEEVIVAAGGSATTDGGRGCIQAIERAGGLGSARIRVLTDVQTLYIDAPSVFGPQKGASPEQIVELTSALNRWAVILPRHPGSIRGGGAAGGLAGGLWAKYDAEIESGAAFVLDSIRFDEKARESDFLIVGEGRLDDQTPQGKIVSVLMKRFDPARIFAVVGSLGKGSERISSAFAGVFVASDLEAMRRAGVAIASWVLEQEEGHC